LTPAATGAEGGAPPPAQARHPNAARRLAGRVWAERRRFDTRLVPIEAAVAAAPPARPVLEEKNYNLSSILLGNPALAVINGRSYSEGEFVRAPKPPGTAPKAASPGEPSSEKTGPPPKVRVARILDGLVELRSGSEVLQLPLRRQEFIPKKTDALESEER
jgi:hypothetical protein